MSDQDYDELPSEDEEPDDDYYEPEKIKPRRGSGGDPIFGLVLVGAISIGLIPLIGNEAADMRYTIVWGLLALFGVTAWLLGNGQRIEQDIPENLGWGIAFGLILGIPLLAFGGTTLTEITEMLFPELAAGTVLAYLIFVMPIGETLFFRGLLQDGQTFWSTAILCTIWQWIMFFPLINKQAFPLVVGVILFLANMMYGYVNERNGLAAAWLCQITVNVLVFFMPFVNVL